MEDWSKRGKNNYSAPEARMLLAQSSNIRWVAQVETP